MAESPEEHLVLFLTFGTIGILTLTVFVILFFFIYQKRMLRLNQQKQDMEVEFQRNMIIMQLDSQEKERKRIASELHDSVSSLLWGAKLNGTFLERTVVLNEEEKEALQELITFIEQTTETVRRISRELTPEVFHHAGLSQSLRNFCERLDGKGMEVTFTEIGKTNWNDDRALQVYRIVQELTSNSLRHSGGTTIKIILQWSPKILNISVKDNGNGFTLNDVQKGVGWWSIEQRALQLKATISIEKTPSEKGVEISLVIPL